MKVQRDVESLTRKLKKMPWNSLHVVARAFASLDFYALVKITFDENSFARGTKVRLEPSVHISYRSLF